MSADGCDSRSAAAGRARSIRTLALGSIVGQLAWVGLVAFAGLAEPGYSEVVQPVSELGARDASHPWLFGVAVSIWGISFIAAAVALRLDAPRGLRGSVGPALIGLTGVAQILAGFPFPADCRSTIDALCHARAEAGDLSWRNAAHGWSYFVGAAGLQLSVFAIAWRLRGDRRWGRADLLAIAAGAIGLAIFAGLFFATGDEMHGHYGLVQRLSLTAGGIWVASLTIGLLGIYGRPGEHAYRLLAWIRTLPGGGLLPSPGGALPSLPRRSRAEPWRRRAMRPRGLDPSTPPQPGRMLKRVLRAPVFLYKIGAGRLLGRRFALLTHRGRRSGRLYRTMLEVISWDGVKREAVVMSGFGPRASWYLNTLAGGAEEIQVAGLRFQPAVRRLEPEEAARVLASYEHRNRLVSPLVRAVLSRLAGFRYDGSEEARATLVGSLPLIGFAVDSTGRPTRRSRSRQALLAQTPDADAAFEPGGHAAFSRTAPTGRRSARRTATSRSWLGR